MKLLLATAVGILCSMPMFAAKPAGEALNAICTEATESCVVTANGLAAGKSYQLQSFSNCGNSTYTAFPSTGVTVAEPESDTSLCVATTFHFYLFIQGSNGTQLKLVATAIASDSD